MNVKAATPNIVEVLINIDAEALIKQFGMGGTLDHPKGLSNQDNYVFMTASKADVLSGFGTAELRVKAKTNQAIQFTSQPLQPIAYSVQLRRCVITAGKECVGDPTCYAIQKTVMVLDPKNRPSQDHPVSQVQYITRWAMDAIAAGDVTYHFTFEVWDNDADGSPKDLGCFTWDPFIKISMQ